MMSAHRARLRRIVHHPRFEFIAGLMLAAAGILEGMEPLLKQKLEHGLPGEWGMVLFGLCGMAKATAGLVEGAEWIERSEHEREELLTQTR